MEVLDNDFFQGRLLHVLPSKPRVTFDKQVSVSFPFLSFGLKSFLWRNFISCLPITMAFLNRDETSNLSKTFKQKKEEARKASEAGGNTKAWNSLFMRQDTVRFSCFKNACLF